MHLASPKADHTNSSPINTSHLARMRLAIGALQGVALYFLYDSATNNTWPATNPFLFAPALLLCVIVPVLCISGLGTLRGRSLAIWLIFAALICYGLGFHDIWRGEGAPKSDYGTSGDLIQYPSILLWLFGIGGFFIGHTLVLSSGIESRRIASYATYFDTAWKLLVQMKFSAIFVGACWAVLWLGAGLFDLIQLRFLKDLIQKSWFSIPITVFAFACAMQLTDVRPAIVQGIRNLLLVLLSWVLPVTLLIVSGFLISLPFTGLSHLWATKHATALLLSASATLIILVNAAFQNGAVEVDVAKVLRVSARLACFLLIPLVFIAIYALGLRVAAYGWTTDRIIAACCITVACCYALGYAWAATRSSGWLSFLAPTNIATAFVVLVILVSLFSPILDPARISVANQVARLKAGLQNASSFDFDYLRFEGKRYGQSALAELKTYTVGQDASSIREKAKQASEKTNRWMREAPRPNASDLNLNLTVWPKGQQLPATFVNQDWGDISGPETWRIPNCLKTKTNTCDVFLMDFDGDNQNELLVIGRGYSEAVLFGKNSADHWSAVGYVQGDFGKCTQFLERLKVQDFKLTAPQYKELEVAGMRIPISLDRRVESRCASETKRK
jgi:hypothetical protein